MGLWEACCFRSVHMFVFSVHLSTNLTLLLNIDMCKVKCSYSICLFLRQVPLDDISDDHMTLTLKNPHFSISLCVKKTWRWWQLMRLCHKYRAKSAYLSLIWLAAQHNMFSSMSLKLTIDSSKFNHLVALRVRV